MLLNIVKTSPLRHQQFLALFTLPNPGANSA